MQSSWWDLALAWFRLSIQCTDFEALSAEHTSVMIEVLFMLPRRDLTMMAASGMGCQITPNMTAWRTMSLLSRMDRGAEAPCFLKFHQFSIYSVM